MKSVVFDDENIRVIFKPMGDVLVISYGDMVSLAKDLEISAEIPLSKYNYSILGISAKYENWYPQKSIDKALESILSIIKCYKKVISYGGSMGGYAAIKFSKIFNSSHVVAFVPQYSIDKNDIIDGRYNKYFNQDNNLNMKISKNDISDYCTYTILYDPYFKPDSNQVNKIVKIIENINILKLRFSDHHATSILANSEILNDLLVFEKNEYIYKKIKDVKRYKKWYQTTLLSAILSKHPSYIFNKLKNNKNIFENYNSELRSKVVNSAMKVSEYSDIVANCINFESNIKSDEMLIDAHNSIVSYNELTNELCSIHEENLYDNLKYIHPISTKDGYMNFIFLNKVFYILSNDENKILVTSNISNHKNFFPIFLSDFDNGKIFISNFKNEVLSCRPDGSAIFKLTKIDRWEILKRKAK